MDKKKFPMLSVPTNDGLFAGMTMDASSIATGMAFLVGELEKRVDSGECAVAFAMFPTRIEELMAIADAGKIMPPKSTWFEPKLRSGLFLHTF